ncbi:MAG: hypothetical protein ABJB34_12565, partial [Acidobacteriota bacterium]
MEPSGIAAYFNNHLDRTIEAIRQIVDIESPSYDVQRSKLVAQWIENEARKLALDLEIERVPAEGYGEHVLIRAFA